MEKEITSKNNALIKDLAKLTLKKYRNQFGLMLVEGERFICDLIKRNVNFKYILYEKKPAFADLLNCTQIKCSAEVLKTLSQTVNSSNIIGVVHLGKREFSLPSSNFLVLDRVSDPGNLGTIIRTALAFDFKDIYLYNCVDWSNDKVLRSSMGTIADINLYECNIENLESLKKFDIFCADMHGVNIENIAKPNKIFGIILGNEANGVSKEISNLSSKTISIKMHNNVESLNVAIAGAIIMSKLV